MAAGATYSQIQTYTSSGNQNTISFTSIPQTYTDLILVCSNIKHSFAGTGQVYDGFLSFNSDSGTNYSNVLYNATGTAVTAELHSNRGRISTYYPRASANPGHIVANIQNYSNTSTYKPTLIRSNVTDAMVSFAVGNWRSTSAITRVDVTVAGSGDYFIDGSIFTLYGIAAA